jgi:hypothetical protein
MSDVPALAFSLVGLALVRRGARREAFGPTLAGGVAAALAATTRQNALAAPLAIALLPARSVRGKFVALAIGTVLPLVAGVAAVKWFNAQSDVNSRAVLAPSARHVVDVILRHAHVLGVSAVPALLLRPRRMLRSRFLLWLGIFAAWTFAWLDRTYIWHNQPYINHLQPPVGNALRATGVYVHQHWPSGLGDATRWVLTVLGVFGLAGVVAGPGGGARLGGAGRAIVGFSVLQAGLLFLISPVYDRYVLVLLPLAVLRTLPRRSPSALDRPRWRSGLAALAVCAAASVALMHDWHSWNAARWELGRRAVARGVDPEDIEGGFEWDGWHTPQIVLPRHGQPPPRPLVLPFNSQLFPRVTGRYAIAFTEPDLGPNEVLPVFDLRPPRATSDEIPSPRRPELVDTEPYTLWLAPGTRRLALIRQDAR